MTNIFISVEDEKLETPAAELTVRLIAAGFNCRAATIDCVADLADADMLILDAATAVRFGEIISSDPATAEVPLILISLETAIDDKLLPLLADMIFLPVRDDELTARLRRLLLIAGKNGERARISVGGMVINLDSYEVTIDGQSLALTFKEYELLKYLAGRPGRVFDRQTLLNQIWDYDYYGGTRTVDVHIRRLRAKLGSRYGSMIHTVRQVGYRFTAGGESAVDPEVVS